MVGQESARKSCARERVELGKRVGGGTTATIGNYRGSPGLPPWGLKVMSFTLAFSNPYIFVSLKP